MEKRGGKLEVKEAKDIILLWVVKKQNLDMDSNKSISSHVFWVGY
jgi:hypothetical protein